MTRPSNRFLVPAIAAGALLAAACADPTGSGGRTGTAAADPAAASLNPTLVECPTAVPVSAEGVIGSLGGTLRAGGTTVDVPALAVPAPTLLRLTIPASNVMEIDVTAGATEHYVFQRSITVTIDYSRCSRSNIDKGPLSVYYIDGSTRSLIENMGGVDDKDARRITFQTGHLSGYAIAN